jgi:hypothetical protein
MISELLRAAVLCAVLISLAAGACTPPGPDPCNACSGTIGPMDASCEGDGCGGTAAGASAASLGKACLTDNGNPVSCEPRCRSGSDCLSGHACADNGGDPVCLPQCDSTLCGGRSECVDLCGTCQAVDCGVVVPCADSSAICSAEQHLCFPGGGTCASDADCPTLDVFEVPTGCDQPSSRVVYGKVSCVDSQCSWQRAPITLPIAGAANIAIQEPSSTTTYGDQSQIVFRWTATGTPVILLAFVTTPANWQSAAQDAIWGDVIADGSASAASWNDGQTITGGNWSTGAPMVATNTPYYLVIEAVRGGGYVGVSDVVPFVVGPWPEPGDACTTTGTIPDGCDNPGRPPQACDNGVCRTLCASDADCPSASACGTATAYGGGSVRFCT